MVIMTVPPQREDFKSDDEFNIHYNKWKKEFDKMTDNNDKSVVKHF